MFFIKNGRYYANVTPQEPAEKKARTISFIIPDGCWLENTPAITCANFIPLYAEDRSYTVDIWVEPADMDDLEAELYDYIGDEITRKPQPVTVNGLEGYDAYYESNTELFYELRLDVSSYGFTDADGYDASRIRVVVHCDKGADIHAIVGGQLVQAVINEIIVE